MVAAYQSMAKGFADSGNPVTVTKPAGTVAGDRLYAVGVTSAASITSSGGLFTEHAESLGGQVPLFVRTAGASEPANYTFNQVGGVFPLICILIVRVSGWLDEDDVSGHTTGGNIVLPSVTSDGPGRLLLQLLVKASGTNTWTPPGGVTERFDNPTPISAAGGDQIVGAGPTGTRTWTPTAADGAVGYMMAIQSVPPEEGQFTGAYDFAGSGFVGAAGPGEGEFTGGYDFAGSDFTGQAGAPSAFGAFTGSYAFDGSGFTGVAPTPPFGGGRWTPGGRDRFTARRTPKNRRRSR